MQFDDLPIDHRIKKNLALQQIAELTDVQQQSIAHAIRQKDIIVAAKTGSGKTLAFAVPAINRLLSQKALSKSDARALILAPTRELAKQVFNVVRSLVADTNLKVCLVVGGENYNDQAKALKRKSHIVVATVGRLADHLRDKHLFLNGLELLILDEADRMLELGFSEQIRYINQQADHRKRQTMMFSATIKQAQIANLTKQLLKSPQTIVVNDESEAHSDIHQRFYFSDNVSQKDAQLTQLLQLTDRQQAIVFTATRDDTQRIADDLNKLGMQAVALHGELIQSNRSQILQAFSKGKHAVLVTTDLGARGLDIKHVALVVNFDLPKMAHEYVHRIGRTGRAGIKGNAVSLVGRKDWKSFVAIKRGFSKQANIEQLEGFETKFTGYKSTTRKPNSKPKAKARKASSTPVNKPKKRFNALNSTEVGDAPIVRKKKPNDEV